MAEKEKVKNPTEFTDVSESSTSQTQQSTTSKKVLDDELLERIMAGLTGGMTQAQMEEYAENLLAPQLNTGLETAQQNYETTRLAKEQEKEDLAATLAEAIAQQQSAYRKSAADVETAAIRRGMGRSSYTMQTLANQGTALSEAVRALTEENARKQSQVQAQITQAAQQNAQTQKRLKTDYAAQLAAKVQELRESQRSAYNQNYMTAVSGALGSQSTMKGETSESGVKETSSGAFKDAEKKS